MTQPLSFRDAEQLSAYLDNQSSQADRQRLDARLKNEPELRGLLAELSQARTLLRSLPARKAPRNFRLTPEMAGIRPPIPRAFPVFRFASALAAVLLFFAFAANLTFPALSALQAAAPAPAMPAAGLASKFAAPLQPAAPAAGIEAAPTLGDAAALQPAATSAGIGGGPTGADTAAPQATEPVRLFAPQTLATSDLTATPETSLMLPAPTQTPEMAATEAPTQAGDMTRNSAADLNTPQPETARPEPLRPRCRPGSSLVCWVWR